MVNTVEGSESPSDRAPENHRSRFSWRSNKNSYEIREFFRGMKRFLNNIKIYIILGIEIMRISRVLQENRRSPIRQNIKNQKNLNSNKKIPKIYQKPSRNMRRHQDIKSFIKLGIKSKYFLYIWSSSKNRRNIRFPKSVLALQQNILKIYRTFNIIEGLLDSGNRTDLGIRGKPHSEIQESSTEAEGFPHI